VEPYATGRLANVSKRKTKAVRTSKDLAAIVQRMREDLAEGGQEEWENRTTWAQRVANMESDISRPDVNDAYQENVRGLCPWCNQGHRMEGR
jgi:hypothetical protein